MMRATQTALVELGVAAEQIHFEDFAPPKPTASSRAETAPPGPRLVQPQIAPTLYFLRSKKAAPFPPDRSILEVAESIDVEIPFSCRVGTCGICITKLVSGQVSMAVEDGLSPADKAAGYVLACQAKSTHDVQVEA